MVQRARLGQNPSTRSHNGQCFLDTVAVRAKYQSALLGEERPYCFAGKTYSRHLLTLGIHLVASILLCQATGMEICKAQCGRTQN